MRTGKPDAVQLALEGAAVGSQPRGHEWSAGGAGFQGGYGKMVEIDHGNGVSTRYGHLSSIDTEVGKTVKTGYVIGMVGTTGRSTGPHLHYETRIDGEAVDPQRFLRAGSKLGAGQ